MSRQMTPGAAPPPEASERRAVAPRAAGGRPPAPDRQRQPAVPEIGGPQGPEPTRYGDWEKGGRCTDF